MKLIGMLMLIVCGAVTGEAFAAAFMGGVRLLDITADLLLQLELIMEHEAPDVRDMLDELRRTSDKLPVFLDSLPEGSGASDTLSQLADNTDGYTSADLERLKMYFSQVGSADRLSELKRLKAVRAYFERRRETERPTAEKKASLSRRLGVLCGILFAVMLI